METIEVDLPTAVSVRSTDEDLIVELHDGRTISVPLAWYPRLSYALAEERAVYELWPGGDLIAFPLLDEHIGLEQVLAGKGSGEGRDSLERWRARLEIRRRARAEGLDPDEVEPWTRWRPLPAEIDDE